MKMIIEKSKATQIINEEVLRYKKLRSLYEAKYEILKQLNEACDECGMEEGLWQAIKGEITKEKALEQINGHKNRKIAYEDAITRGRGEKYLNFVMKHPNDPFFVWDEKLKDYKTATIKTDASGLSSPRKFEEGKSI